MSTSVALPQEEKLSEVVPRIDAFSALVRNVLGEVRANTAEWRAQAAIFDRFDKFTADDVNAWLDAEEVVRRSTSHSFEPSLETLRLSNTKWINFKRRVDADGNFTFSMSLFEVEKDKAELLVEVSSTVVSAAVLHSTSFIVAGLMASPKFVKELKSRVLSEPEFAKFDQAVLQKMVTNVHSTAQAIKKEGGRL